MTQERQRSFWRAIDLSFVMGAMCTVAFYWAVFQPGLKNSVLAHYTTEHAVEYVVVALFLWGLCDAFLKMLSFPREILALRRHWLAPRSGREPIENARKYFEVIGAKPRWMLQSRIGKRLHQALGYIVERDSADGFTEHLKYLADQDDEQSYSNYTLMRFLVGVMPVLGLVGTVVHFGTALSGISFDQMVERLELVVSEMGTAFNTTTVALAGAITMMFSMFVCEKTERGVVRTIDRFIDRELAIRFEHKDTDLAPHLAAIQQANESALQSIVATLQRSSNAWTDNLATLFQKFDERQRLEVQQWRQAVENLQQRQVAFDASREEQLVALLSAMDDRRQSHVTQISSLVDQIATLRDEFSRFVDSMQNVTIGEQKIVELQAILSDNLRVINQTQQLDEALHGLTAAIHLLTARNRPFSRPDSAAA